VKPLVTIGIPTFHRPELLARALAAVARQGYPSLEVLVADNATPGDSTSDVVESYRKDIPVLAYVKHAKNIGPLANFKFLLDAAHGRYFMWLADDDEISANYVDALVEILEADPRASSAAGHWKLMQSEQAGELMPTSSYPQRSAVVRALRFIWRSDDAFFYGLHRTDVLRQASFRGYWWPNRRESLNWAYVYLLDVVLRGPVLMSLDASVQFINHDYTTKTYATGKGRFARIASTMCRRFNVHYLYWEKCFRLLPPLSIPMVVGTSLLSMLREASAIAIGRMRRLA
jgi:glycosyltransferase involved in cell wall biosynthesis